jgi:integrase
MTVCNRPAQGSRIKVEPIRSLQSLHRIREKLQGRPRDRALFDLGVNLPLRVVDLLGLSVDQVRDLRTGDSLRGETGRRDARIRFNRVCVAAVADLLHECLQAPVPDCPADEAAFLFPSRRGGALLPSSLHRLVKSWCRDIGLTGNFGATTLRKTWGFHQLTTFGTDLTLIMHCFGHATRRQTLEYLCLSSREHESIFDHEI